jgi:hypothetical protein
MNSPLHYHLPYDIDSVRAGRGGRETWNLDHIVPRSDLPYASMTEDNFKKCWALSNMRPYSAKQNMIDGTTRARHAKKSNKEK